jgi:PspAA-like protein
VIVRISGEGQWRLSDGARELVNEKDNAAVEAVGAGDEAAFRSALAELLATVREQGEELADDDLSPSDVILPPADLSFAEAAAGEDFSGEGLIPD